MFPILIYFKMYFCDAALIFHQPLLQCHMILQIMSFLIFFWTGDTFFFELKS